MQPDSAIDPLFATPTETLDAHPDAVGVFDYELRLRYLNNVAVGHLRAAGLDPQALIGKNVFDALPQLRGSEWERGLEEVVRSRQPVSFERHSTVIGRWTET